jgi:glycosyltransferase involved in cell wall biosynthesis
MSKNKTNNKVLYLSYTGMMEALGESQVLNYLYGLSNDFGFHLISLEKAADYYDEKRRKHISNILTDKGIKWHPLLYKNGKIGYASNFFRVYKVAKNIYRNENISFLHCRSYMPTIIAYCIKKTNKRLEYIFDTRGFWFDEKIDVGDWQRNGFVYKLSKWIEKKLYLSAKHIVMLSYQGKKTILNNGLFYEGHNITKISVIPTCVNLERFKLSDKKDGETLRIGYIGTAIGWYNFPKTVELLSILKKYYNYELYIYNGGQHEYIEKELNKINILRHEYVLERVPFENISEKLKKIDISIFFIHSLFSKKASAATKLGELFASGIPVITNDGVGDHEYYINTYSVGKIVDINKLDSYNYHEIIENLSSEDCKKKCRHVAEKYFSLSKGVESYKNIYNEILNQ